MGLCLYLPWSHDIVRNTSTSTCLTHKSLLLVLFIIIEATQVLLQPSTYPWLKLASSLSNRRISNIFWVVITCPGICQHLHNTFQGSKCKADIARTWGKYCHLLLQTSIEKKYIGEDEENEFERDSNLDSSGEVMLPLGFENADVPYVAASDFEQARKIFIPGQKFYNQAKEFYSFENHCVDYTEINQVHHCMSE